MDYNFLSLDLEFNQPSRNIIQVGICIGNIQQSENDYIIKKWYVDPREPISEEITKLTGITDTDIVDYAVPMATVATELSDMIKTNKCFVNPITWGGGDSDMLLRVFSDRNIEFPHFGHRWIDVKTITTYLAMALDKKTSGGLSSVMGRYHLSFKGEAHRADVDAFNTLRLFFKVSQRQQVIEDILKMATTLK